MNKKYSIIVLAIFLIITFIVPQGCAQNSTNATLTQELRLIEFETTTEITLKNETLPENPMNPGQTKKDIEATVQFKFEKPWYFPRFLLDRRIGKWIIFRDINYDMSINISLSVAEKPKWCDVELPKQVTIKDIGTDFKEALFRFNITVNETVLAFQEGDIKIQAAFIPEDAWGLESSASSDIFTVKSNLVGGIQARFDLPENTTEVKFKGGQTKTLPLYIENGYNAKTIIQIQVPEEVKNNTIWNVTIEQKSIELEAGKNITVNVNVTPKKSDSYKNSELSYSTGIIKLTPKLSEDQNIVLDEITVDTPKLIVEDDGNLGEILTMILYAIIIIVIIAFVIWIILRKINR